MYKFPPSLSGLKSLSSDFITNSYDLINQGDLDIRGDTNLTGNLTVSGTLQSPVTDLLGVSNGILDTFRTSMLNTTMPQYLTRNETVLPSTFTTWVGNNNKIINTSDNIFLQSSGSNCFFQFDTSTLGTNGLLGFVSDDFQFRNPEGVFSFQTGGTNEKFRINQDGNSVFTNNLTVSGTLQSPITNLLSVSSGIMDSKIYTLGVSSGVLQSQVNNLSTFSISGQATDVLLSISSANMDYTNYLQDGRLNTVEILSVSFDNRITTNENDNYNLGVTTELSLLRLDDIETELVSIDTRLDSHDLKWGTTGSLSVTSITIEETLFETADDIKGYINDGLTAINTVHNGYVVYNEIRTNGLQATLSSHLAEWNGYQVLQEAEDTTQNTNIATNTGGIAINSGLIAANLVAIGTLTAGVATNSLDISNIGVSVGNLSTYDGILGISIGVLDNFKNSFSLSTTTSLNSINSSITNLGTSNNSQQVTIDNYLDRIDLNTLDITFKGSTIPSMILTDSGLGITGNLTVSGALQSPITNLLSVSSGILDTFRTNMISVTMPQYLTRNEITLPETFSSWGTTTGNKTINNNASVLFNSGNSQNSYIRFKTGGSANETLLGTLNTIDPFLRLPTTSSILRFQNNNDTSNLWTMTNSGHVVNSGNLTVSGTLQSPITNLLSVSSGIIDGKVYTLGVSSGIIDGKVYTLGISHTNLSGYVYSLNNSTLGVSINNNTTAINTNTGDITTLGVSHSNLSSYVYSLNNSTLGVSINNNTTAINTLSVSSGILDTFRTSMISVTMPQYLTRNETTLPSSFINSSLTKLGVSAIVGKAGTDSVKYDFQVGSDGSTNSNPRDTKAVISSGGENKNAWLILGTPNNPSDGVRAMKTAIIAEGLSSYSRNKLHFCMSNTLDNNETTGNVSLSDSLMSLDYNGLLTVTGSVLGRSNLTVSGTLQSPLTSLLSVSSGILDTFRTSMISVTMPQYLTRNETVVPSSFLSSSLTTLGTLTKLGVNKTSSAIIPIMVKGTSAGTGLIHLSPTSTGTENTIYFANNATSTTYDTGTEGTWVVGNNIAGNDSNSFSIWNPNLNVKNFKLDINGHGLFTNNLTVSGALQSPLTSLLGVSISNLSTGNIGNIWGTTSSEKNVNTNSYLEINSQDANNSYIRFKNTGNGNYSLFGQIDNDDTFIRLNNSSGTFKIQNSSGVNKLTLSDSGNTVISGTLSSGAITSTGASSFGSDTTVYNSGGNANFKIQSNGGVMRLESNGTPDLTIWNNSNQDVAVFGNNRVSYFKNTIEVSGNSTSSGICYASTHIPTSSIKYKKNIKKIENNNLIDKLEFKSYDKILDEEDGITFKDCGLIIEEIEDNEILKDFIHNHNNMKYLNYNGIFCNLFSELIEEITKLKEEINSLKN